MKRNIYNSVYYCVLGLILIVISTMAIIQRDNFLMRVFDVFGWILIINGFHGLGVFIKRHLKGDLFNIIINIVIGFIIIIYTTIPIRLLFARTSLILIIKRIKLIDVFLFYVERYF